MLGINCLLDNPTALPIATSIVKKITDALMSKYKSAPIGEVYSIIRSSGIEMDLNTVAKIYLDQNNRYDSGLTPDNEVYAMLSSSIGRILSYTPQDGREIGRLAPASEAAIRVSSMIQKAMDLTVPDDSIQRQLQDRLVKAAKRILQRDENGREILSRKDKTGDPIQLIKDVFDLGNKHPDGIFGRLSSGVELWDSFKEEIKDLSELTKDAMFGAQIEQMADVLQASTYELLLSSQEARSALHEILKKAGFTKVSNGEIQIDWDNITKTNPNIYQLVIDVLRKEGVNSIAASYAAKTLENEYKTAIEARIKDQLSNIIQDRGQLEKYSVLAVQNPEAFVNARNNAMLSAIGLGNVPITTVVKLRGALQSYNLLIKNPKTAFSPTYKAILERKIRNDIERAMESNGTSLMSFARNYQLVSQFGMGLILSNPGNIIENTLSGISSMIDAAISDPFTILEAIKRSATTGLDVSKGGVRIGSERANINSASVNLDDRTTRQEKGNSKAKIWANLFQRLTLSATDALFGQAVYSSVEFRAIRFVLKAKGFSDVESMKIINELYFKNTSEIENLADTMINSLQSFDIEPSKQTKERIVNELLLSNLTTNGFAWEHLANQFEIAGKTELADKMRTTHIQTEILIKIRDIANAVRARAMGHQSDTILGSFIEKIYSTNMNDAINRSMKRASSAATTQEYKTETRKQAGMELARGLFGNAVFARRGALNWAFLGLARSTGIPLISTLIFDIAIRGGIGGKLITKSKLQAKLDELSNQSNTNEFLSKLDQISDDLEYTYAVRQRLIRNTLGTIIGGIAASSILTIMKQDCAPGDEECIANKVKNWKDRGYLRSFEKLFPYILNGYLNNQLDEFNKIKPESDRPSSLTEYYGNTLGANGLKQTIEAYKTYVEKNGIANDKVIVPILNMMFPPKYVEEHEKDGYRMATMGDMISSAVGLRHMKAVDIWADRISSYTRAKDDLNTSQIKHDRNELIPETFMEGVLSGMLERNTYRWYLKNYGHLSAEYIDNKSLVNLIGIGDKTQQKLEAIGIKAISDLKGKTPQQIRAIRDNDNKHVFSELEAVSVHNQINLTGISKTGRDISEIDFTQEEQTRLIAIGIKSIGTENKQDIINKLGYLYNTTDGKKEKQLYRSLISKIANQ